MSLAGLPTGVADHDRLVATARVVMVLAHAVALAFAIVQVVFGVPSYGDLAGDPVLPALALAGVAALQWRHSLATAEGERPAMWRWSLLALAVLVCAPAPFWQDRWQVAAWPLVASALMLLPRPLALAVPVAGAVVTGVHSVVLLQPDVLGGVLSAVYRTLVLLTGGWALYASARLVRLVNELVVTRETLAELAVVRERLRLSRDVHDLLGQTLSAISLKGDLARRLAGTDCDAAAREIHEVSDLARDSLRQVRAATHDEHAVSLAAELSGAEAVLDAARVHARVEVDPGAIPERVQALLAWSVREGVTNVLRHSDATRCEITAERVGGTLTLRLRNDGAAGDVTFGSGLVGLDRRARALGGRVRAAAEGGWFDLRVEVPA